MNKYEKYLKQTEEIGRINSIDHSVVKVSGLPNLTSNEMVITKNGQRGIVYNIGEEYAEVLMLETKNLNVKKPVTRTGETFKVGINSSLKGRVINPLCTPLDEKGPITGKKQYRKLEKTAPNITERNIIEEHLKTGISKVDLLIPLGHGQRELILGDKKVGKTTLALQAIANQARQGTTCIYVSIGKRASDLKRVENYLRRMGVLDKVIIVRAGAGAPSPTLYIAPYAGMSIAEYFRDQGENTLIVFDDLTTHAKIYREISLLLERPPGRSSYPGDIFHIHASLLERAGNKKSDGKETSITALPIADTLENDISGYIQTNLMAITDGHIFFDSEKARKGIRPSIDVFLSVSRVGNQTKKQMDRELARIVRRKMTEYNRAQEIARFGVELPQETRSTLDFGKKLKHVFTQPASELFSREFQLLLIGLLITGYWGEDSPDEVKQEISTLVERYQQDEFTDIEERIEKINNLDAFKRLIKAITTEIEEY